MPRDRVRKRRFGDFGERVAAAHLESKGYTVLERNWAIREGEVDIIASRGSDLIFVEVRSRRGRELGTPEESVVGRKQAHVIAAAAAYCQQHPEAPPNHRIDVIAIELDHRGRVMRVEQIENAFGED